MADVDFLTGVGRIVWGHPLRSQFKTDNDGKPVLNDKGEKIPQWSFGLAIQKGPDADAVIAAMSQAATGVPGNNLPNFAWKFKDGDTALDQNGKPLRDKPGYAGCIVLAISTEAAEPKVFKLVGASQWQPLSADELKTGDFVRVRLMIKGHGAKQGVRGSNPGLYLNPNGIEWIAYGDAIFTGQTAEQMFGDAPRPTVLPPGASLTPTAPSQSTAMPSSAPPAPIAAPSPMAAPAPMVALPPGSPSPMVAPGPIAPVAALAPAPLAAAPAPSPAAIASPSNVQPAHDFVANAAGRQPVAFDPTNGKPIYAYQPGTNRPVYGYDPSGQWPIYGFDPAGQPIYQ